MEQTLRGKVALISGGTRGIGRASAEGLARLGAHVVVVGRGREAGEATLAAIRAAGGSGELLSADLSLMAEVRRLAAVFRGAHARLDILIHSADVLRVQRVETGEGLEVSFATNYLSRFLLNQLLLDRLAAAPGRILHVAAAGFPGRLDLANVPPGPRLSSFAGHNIGQRANDVYVVEQAARLAGSGVTINVLNPGMVDTDIRRRAGEARLLMRAMELMLAPFAVPPEQFARLVLRLVAAPETATWSGRLISAKGQPLRVRPAVADPAARAALWSASARLVGLEPSPSAPAGGGLAAPAG